MDRAGKKQIDLQVAAQRRVPRPVLAAAYACASSTSSPCGTHHWPGRHVVALTDDQRLWWIAKRRWSATLGPTVSWIALDADASAHTEEIRGFHHRFRVEISRPYEHLLVQSEVYGPGAEHLVGQIDIRELTAS